MGLLNKLVNKVVAPVMNTVSAVFTHPVQTISAAVSPTKTISQVVAKHTAEPTAKKVTETLLTTAGYAGAVVGGAAVATASKAGTLVSSAVAAAKAVIPTSTKGKVIAAVAAPVVVGAVVSQPSKVAAAVTSAPRNLANFGGNVANLVAEPSVQNVKTLVKENPIITTAVAAATVATVAGGVGLAANTTATLLNTQAQKEVPVVTAPLVSLPEGISSKPLSEPTGNNQIQTKGEQLSEQLPVTPATQTVSAKKTSSTRHRKSYKQRKDPSMNQRVTVLVNAKASNSAYRKTQRYLNRAILTH